MFEKCQILSVDFDSMLNIWCAVKPFYVVTVKKNMLRKFLCNVSLFSGFLEEIHFVYIPVISNKFEIHKIITKHSG